MVEADLFENHVLLTLNRHEIFQHLKKCRSNKEVKIDVKAH